MKKVICLLLTVLLLCSTAGLHAFAASTPTVDEAGIHMDKGDVIRVYYRDLYDRTNKAVPKGGHIEWYWATYGGRAEFTLSKDQKYCTVRAGRPGQFGLGCEVYNARGEMISDDAIFIDVSSPAYRGVNLATLGLYGSARYFFWHIMAQLQLLPIRDIT